MTVLAKSAGAAQMVCTFSGVIINVDEARQRDHKSGRNYAYDFSPPPFSFKVSPLYEQCSMSLTAL